MHLRLLLYRPGSKGKIWFLYPLLKTLSRRRKRGNSLWLKTNDSPWRIVLTFPLVSLKLTLRRVGRCKILGRPEQQIFAKRLTPWVSVAASNPFSFLYFWNYFNYFGRSRCPTQIIGATKPCLLQFIGAAFVSDAQALPLLYKLLGRPRPPLPSRFRRPC